MSRQIHAAYLKCLFSLVLLLAIALPALGQSSSTAGVTGIVQDTSDARIPNAGVKLINTQTGTESTSKTNGGGNFALPNVMPGRYTLQIERDGFETTQLTGITLNVGDNKNVVIRMKVGSKNETVTVDGSGLTINITDGSVSTVVNHDFVQNMPLNGRSFQSLILLTPGVVTNSPQSTGAAGLSGEFSVNGQRTESNAYTLDGVSANTGSYEYGYGTPGTSGSLPAASVLGTTQNLVSVDALQEFRVASSSYSAEYGLSPGGQFSFTTRSGTNDLHGTAFDYLRNNYFDANDWFNDYLNKPATALRQNDFGGTAGGPIWLPKLYSGRDRSFFFVSYEGLRLTQPQAALTYYVPSLSLRQEAPSALQPVLDALPLPSGASLSNGLAPFVQTDSLPSSIDSTSFRLDHQLTKRLKIFYRFSDTQSSTESRVLSSLSAINQANYTHTLGITTTLSNKVANDFRLNYTLNVGGNGTLVDGFGGATPANLLQLQGIDPSTNSMALAEVGFQFAGYNSSVEQDRETQPQHAWNLVDSTTIVKGRHTLKLGVSYREIASRLQESSPYVYSFFNSSSAVIDNSSYDSSAQTHATSYPTYTNLGLYVQDELRINPKLGVSLGLRWDVNPPPSQRNGLLPSTVQGNLADPATLILSSPGTRFWKTSHANFAPRLGVAYQVHSQRGWETTLRSGGGVFFDSGEEGSTQVFGNTVGQSATAYYTNVSYPLTSAQLYVPIVAPPQPPYYETFYFPKHLQLPYTWQWNGSIEQSLGSRQAVTVSYVGSNGRRLLSQELLQSTNPNFTYIYDETSGTTSNYNALQITFQRTVTSGLQVLGSYGWSHSIDYGSQNLDFTQIRGNSDYDLRHNLNIAITYDIHATNGSRMVQSILERWGVDSRFSARTAFPVILDGNEVLEPDGQFGYTGLDLVPGAPLYLQVQGIAGNREINPAAFALPATGQNGNAPRNFVRGFGDNQLDLAARRSIPLHEQIQLQFRAEAFNVLNHPNFGYIEPEYGNVQFGQATKMLNQSLGGLSPLYQQGGPRSMQFALKVVF